MSTKQVVKDLTKEFEDGFDVRLTSKTVKGVTTFTEESSETRTSTPSLRINWLKRRAKTLGFENVGPNQFKFVGTPEEEPPSE